MFVQLRNSLPKNKKAEDYLHKCKGRSFLEEKKNYNIKLKNDIKS